MRGVIVGTFGLSLIVHAGLLALVLRKAGEPTKASEGPTVTISLVKPPAEDRPKKPNPPEPKSERQGSAESPSGETAAKPDIPDSPAPPAPPPAIIANPDAQHDATAPTPELPDKPKPVAATPAKPDAPAPQPVKKQAEAAEPPAPPPSPTPNLAAARPIPPDPPKSDVSSLPPVPPPPKTSPPPPVTEPPPAKTPPGPVSRQKVERAIKEHEGGGCFFAAPALVDHHVVGVDGFAESEAALKTLDQSLGALGFEPALTGQRIWSPQCPVVDFLRTARRNDQNPPVLTLDRDSLHSGDLLGGTISNVTQPIVGLFWISETGAVQDLSQFLHDKAGTKVFRLNIDYEGQGGPLPQMLLVVTSTRPLSTTIQGVDTSAAAFFPALSSRAASGRQRMKATARLFQLSH